MSARPALPAPFVASPRWLGFLIVCIAGATYANAVGAAFVFDDSAWIAHNPWIRRPWYAVPFLTDSGRPVAELSLALNYAWGGLAPAGYHLFNLVAHVLAALTLFGLVRRTLALPRFARDLRSEASAIAFAVALLWVVHPVAASAAVYVVQRMEVLAALGGLVSLYALLRSTEGARSAWTLAAIAASAFAMGAKQVAAVIPVLALLYDATFLTRSPLAALRARPGLYAGLAATWGVLLWAGAVGGDDTAGFGSEGVRPIAYLLSQPGVILHYVGQALWPAKLCIDWQWPVATGRAIALPVLGLAPVVLATVAALWRRHPSGFLGGGFALWLAPSSSFLPIQDLAVDYRMYLPLAAVLCAVVLGLRALLRTTRLAAAPAVTWALLLVAVLALAARTVVRNEDYRTPVALWEATLAVSTLR